METHLVVGATGRPAVGSDYKILLRGFREILRFAKTSQIKCPGKRPQTARGRKRRMYYHVDDDLNEW